MSGRRKYSHREVIHKLGNKCALCRCKDLQVLQIDHPRGNGSLERKTKGQQAIYRRIMEGHSDEYRCLCASCNWRERVRHNPGGRQVKAMTEDSLEQFKAELRQHLLWLLGPED